MEVRLQTGSGVFEVLSHVSRSPLDALRQFVENAADALQQAERTDGRIGVRLTEVEGTVREIAVEDNGAGMSPDKMGEVLRRIGHSEKVNSALRGEKGVGILAFALIGQELHLNSCRQDGLTSACLVLRQEGLRQGKGEVIYPCPQHTMNRLGTTAHLMGIVPESAVSFTWKRLKEYLGREFSVDLRRNAYDLVLEGGGRWEPVRPQRFRGISVLAQNIPLASFGHVTAEFHVLPVEAPDALVGLYGRGGVRICSLSALEPFKGAPWQDSRLEGYVRCDRLKRTADKTAVVQDRVYWELVAALKPMEARLKQEIARVTQEHLERRLGKVVRQVDLLVERFLRYLEEGAPLQRVNGVGRRGEGEAARSAGQGAAHAPQGGKRPGFQPLHYQLAEPESAQREWRSWEDGGQELVHVNREHPDFLEASQDDGRCARYLFALWAKEHLLSEYGSDARKVSELLVSWLNKADPILGQL